VIPVAFRRATSSEGGAATLPEYVSTDFKKLLVLRIERETTDRKLLSQTRWRSWDRSVDWMRTRVGTWRSPFMCIWGREARDPAMLSQGRL